MVLKCTMVDNPMQEDRLVVPSSEVRGSGANCLWVDRAGRHGMDTVDLCMVASSVVLRTLATRGRKRGAPRRQAWGDGAERKVRWTIPLATTTSTMKNEETTSAAPWGLERNGRSEGQHLLRTPRQQKRTTTLPTKKRMTYKSKDLSVILLSSSDEARAAVPTVS